MREKKDILVVTPALSCGGWISLEEPINNSADRFNFTVVGLGPVRQRARKFALYRMPYFDYAKAITYTPNLRKRYEIKADLKQTTGKIPVCIASEMDNEVTFCLKVLNASIPESFVNNKIGLSNFK